MKSKNKESEFKALYKNGKRIKTEIGTFIIEKSLMRRMRIVINRRIGKAVERNRIKRAIREAARRCPREADIVLMVSNSNINYTKALESIVFALNKANNDNPGAN